MENASRGVGHRFLRAFRERRPAVALRAAHVARRQSQYRRADRSIIDGDVRTNGFDHFKNVSCSTAKDGSLACEVTTDRGDAVCLQSLHRGAVKSWTAEASGRLAQARGTVRLAAGKAAVIEKLSAVSTSRDLAPAPCATVLAAASNIAYEALLAEHRSLWNGRWAESDVEIEGHDVRKPLFAPRSTISCEVMCEGTAG
jgi:trehalose/maltose hydrolase-like predicted phosphorylase